MLTSCNSLYIISSFKKKAAASGLFWLTNTCKALQKIINDIEHRSRVFPFIGICTYRFLNGEQKNKCPFSILIEIMKKKYNKCLVEFEQLCVVSGVQNNF